MIELYQFEVAWDLPSPSPFCLKIEAWLRLAELPYTVCAWTPTRAPHGKAPFVVVDGEVIADSSVIVERLSERFDVDLDGGLTEVQRAHSVLIQRTLEEHTYFALLVDRWLDDAVWADYRRVIGQPAPALVRRPFTAWLRRGVRQATWGQGLARLPTEQLHARAITDVDAVLAVLGDGPFVHGEAPTSIDATVYAWFAILQHPIGRGRFADHCRAAPALAAYVERMRERLWPEGESRSAE